MIIRVKSEKWKANNAEIEQDLNENSLKPISQNTIDQTSGDSDENYWKQVKIRRKQWH